MRHWDFLSIIGTGQNQFGWANFHNYQLFVCENIANGSGALIRSKSTPVAAPYAGRKPPENTASGCLLHEPRHAWGNSLRGEIAAAVILSVPYCIYKPIARGIYQVKSLINPRSCYTPTDYH